MGWNNLRKRMTWFWDLWTLDRTIMFKENDGIQKVYY